MPSRAPTPRVFISYSGPLSRQVATELLKALQHHLGLTIRLFPHLEGKPIWEELIEALEVSTFGICCVTTDNARSRWIHFEAGSLLKLQPHPPARSHKERASPVVPFYYPTRPSAHDDHSDDPLWSYTGVSADVDGFVRLVKRVAEHSGLRRPSVEALKATWRRSIGRIEQARRKQDALIRVGRFSRFHNQILDNCSRIDDGQNDFRKFLCHRMLDSVRSATSELVNDRLDMRTFGAFARAVCDELDHAVEIVALCGNKPWHSRCVREYYAAQFAWARNQRTKSGTSPWRMRRVFIRSRRWHSPAVQRRIEQMIQAHRSLADCRVAAGAMAERTARAVEPVLTRVWDDLIGRGFGFIALRKPDGWKVFVHMSVREGSKARFLSTCFATGPVTNATLSLFDDLWERSTIYGYVPAAR